MITTDRAKCIIDTIRIERLKILDQELESEQLYSTGFSDTVTLKLDRWILNDLCVVLNSYQKEFLSDAA
jgi:hypothetical protein